MGFHDRGFANEMALKIRETTANYEATLFKEALRTGFFELQAARDKYRETAPGGMHKELFRRFVRTQTLLLWPICPHIADYVWTLMEEEKKLWEVGWPSRREAKVDEFLIRESAYLMDAAHAFRVAKKALATKGKKKGVGEVAVNFAVVWVARHYPKWQAIILSRMLELYEERDKSLPDNKMVSSVLTCESEVKKHGKKVMPFVQKVREKFEKIGVDAFCLNSPLEEMKVLEINKEYLRQTLELDGIEFFYTDMIGAPSSVEYCCPEYPHIIFEFRSPSVDVKFINPTPCSTFFTCNVSIYEGQTVKSVQDRLKFILQLQDEKMVSIWIYENPLSGTFIPSADDYFAGKIKLDAKDEFTVNLDEKRVFIKRPSASPTLIYETIYTVH